MKDRNNEILLKESFEFIDKNINVFSNEIPQSLIEFWMVEDIQNFNLEETGETNQGSVFMYALIKQKSNNGLSEFSIEPEKLMEMYQNWQIILNAISVSNLTDIEIEPFKVFDFENLNKLELTIKQK